MRKRIKKKCMMILVDISLILFLSFLVEASVSINITSPEKDDTLSQRYTNITWNYSMPDNETGYVRLFYDTDTNPVNGRNKIVTNLDPEKRSYKWLLSGTPTGEFHISGDLVTSTYEITTDYSPQFTRLHFNKSHVSNNYSVKVSQDIPNLEVTSPSKNETLRNKHKISFNYTENEDYKHAYIKYFNDSIERTITDFSLSEEYCNKSGESINCSYIWDFPEIEGDYNLSVEITDGIHEVSDTSPQFSLEHTPEAKIGIPEEDSYISTSSVDINWTSSDISGYNISRVDVFIDSDKRRGNYNDKLLAGNMSSTGNYTWQIPSDFPNGEYYFYVMATSKGQDPFGNNVTLTETDANNVTIDIIKNLSYESNGYEVSVSQNNPPVPTLIEPTGGESYRESVEIRFNVSDPEGDEIQISIYNSTSNNSLGTPLIQDESYVDYCSDPDRTTKTENNCSYTWDTTNKNIQNNHIHILLNDSIKTSNTSSDAFLIDNIPIISNVSEYNATSRSVYIEWDTNEVADSKVYYGEEGNLNNTFENTTYVKDHTLFLDDIKGNRQYFYKVQSCDSDGEEDCINSSTYGDTSIKQNFTIQNNPPKVNVTYPKGGEEFSENQIPINWTASDRDGDNITINLYYDTDKKPNNGREKFAESIQNDGTSNLNLRGLSHNKNYYVSVEAISYNKLKNINVSTSGYSGNFTLSTVQKNYTSNSYEVKVDRNHPPKSNISRPKKEEIINEPIYDIKFNVSDNDSSHVSADLYYSRDGHTSKIIEDLDLSDETICDYTQNNESYDGNCSYTWDTSSLEDDSYEVSLYTNDSILETQSNVSFILNLGPDNFSINLKNITESSVVVEWKSNKPTDSKVYYGLNESLESNTTKDTEVIDHSVKIRNLSPNKKHYLYTESCDSYNNCSNSSIKEFYTKTGDVNINLTYPNSGEVLQNTTIVNWTTSKVADNPLNISIYYDNDRFISNGAKTFVEDIPNTGNHTVNLTGVLSDDYYMVVEASMIRESDNKTMHFYDYSDEKFSVSRNETIKTYTSNSYEVSVNRNHPPVINITNPKEGETYDTRVPFLFNLTDDNGDPLTINSISYRGGSFYRKEYSFTNPSESEYYENYPVKITLDTKSLIEEEKLGRQGHRLTLYSENEEIPYHIEEGTYNTNKTEIWFEINLLPEETKTIEFKYGLSAKIHMPREEPDWSNFKLKENIMPDQEVVPTTEEEGYPATHTIDQDETTRWRGTNYEVGIVGHNNSIEWIKYIFDDEYQISKLEYVLTGSGINHTQSLYAKDNESPNLLINDTYDLEQGRATYNFLPKNMSKFYMDIRSLITDPEFYEIKMYEPVMLDYTEGEEEEISGQTLISDDSYTEWCDDPDLTTTTPNNCTYNWDSEFYGGTFQLCINVTDDLKDSFECSPWFRVKHNQSLYSYVQSNANLSTATGLIMKVQYYNSSSSDWEDVETVYNSSGLVEWEPFKPNSLEKYWEENGWDSSNAPDNTGRYRAYAGLTDKEGNVIEYNPKLYDTYEFKLKSKENDTTIPSFENLNNISILNNESLNYRINATDPAGIDTYQINDTTDFKINSSSGLLANNTVLYKGNYSFSITVNDTAGNYNTTPVKIRVIESMGKLKLPKDAYTSRFNITDEEGNRINGVDPEIESIIEGKGRNWGDFNSSLRDDLRDLVTNRSYGEELTQEEKDDIIKKRLDNPDEFPEDKNVIFSNENNKKKFEIAGRFSGSDVDLRELMIRTNNITTVVNVDRIHGVGSTHKLYVPNTLNKGVYVCPNAKSLSEVSKGCSNKTLFTYEESLSGMWKDGIKASIQNENYLIENLTNSGVSQNNDTKPPTFENLKNISMMDYESLSYDINASDSTGINTFWINDTINFKIDSTTGLLQNNTDLGFGNYSLNVSVNDTYGNTNSGEIIVEVNSSGYLIKELDSELDVIGENRTHNFEEIGQEGLKTGLLRHETTGLEVANLSINFTRDYNWSNISADISGSMAKSVLHVPGGHEEIKEKVLKVPVQFGTGKVYICPNAVSLTEVDPDCNNMYLETALENKSGYYRIGVSSTGAAEVASSNLTIWDDTNDEEGENTAPSVNEKVGFYANYTDTAGDTLTQSTCRFKDNNTGNWSSTTEMTFNSSSKLYEYTTTFDNSGTYYYNITCDGNSQGYEVMSSMDDFVVDVDIIPPEFIYVPSDNTITYGDDWAGVNFDAEDSENSIDLWWINDTDKFKINQSGYLNDHPKLSPGTYNINVSINDTKGNTNSTIYTLTVNKATPSLNMSVDPAWTVEYGVKPGIFGDCPSYLTCDLYRDGNEVVEPHTSEEVGTYDYEFNTTGNENYSSHSLTNTLTIQKASVNMDLIFENDTMRMINEDMIVEHGTNITVKSTIDIPKLEQIENDLFRLYKDEDKVGERDRNNITYTDNTLSVGEYHFNSTWYGNENYSYSSRDSILTVEDTSPPQVNIIQPEDGEKFSSSTSQVTLKVTTNENSSCEYSLDGGSNNKTMNSDVTEHTASISVNSGNSYTSNVYCTDPSGKENNTENVSFSVESSGGGGGGSTCNPDWECTDWNLCEDGTQTRTCTDNNDCGTTEDKPEEEQECCVEDWTCDDWGECEDGTQTRNCTDQNSCGTTNNKPIEQQTCCVEDWECTDWGECTNGTQTRTCTDNNECGTTDDKPKEQQECCVEDWECTDWSECIGGNQTRTCKDQNECGTTEDKPDESQLCGCVPSWNCTDWSECEDGTRTRECTDEHNCDEPDTKPLTEESCCANNEDCEDGKVCKEGNCTDCETDTDCSEGYTCTFGTCEKATACEKDDDCKSSYSCEEGECILVNESFAEPSYEEESKSKDMIKDTSKKSGVSSAPCYSSEKETTITELVNPRDIETPPGRDVITEPFELQCSGSSTTLNLVVPKSYTDYEVKVCDEEGCEVKKTVGDSMLECEDGETKDRTRKVDKYEPQLDNITTNITTYEGREAERKLLTSNAEIIYGGDINKTSIESLKSPIDQPENPSTEIVGEPLVLTTNTSNLTVNLHYDDTDQLDESTIKPFYLKNSKWHILEGEKNKDNNTVEVQLTDVSSMKNDEGKIILSLLGSIASSDNTEFENVYSPEFNPNAALILVHGLGSTPETYQPLINDYSLTNQPIDLYTFGYPMDLPLSNVSSDLAGSINLKSSSYDKIFIVGHSLGGVVSQLALKEGQEKQLSFYDKVEDIILLASPNNGIKSFENVDGIWNVIINSPFVSSMYDLDSQIFQDLKNLEGLERLPEIDYNVIAGNKPITYDFEKTTISTSKILSLRDENDGIISIDNAKSIGDHEFNKVCKNYWEFQLNHVEIEEAQLTRQLVGSIIAKNLGLDKIRTGSTKYVELTVPACEGTKQVFVTGTEKTVEEKSAFDLCMDKYMGDKRISCHDGVQNNGEEGVDCGGPCEPCEEKFSPDKISLNDYLVLILGLIALLIALTFSYLSFTTPDIKKIKNQFEKQKPFEMEKYRRFDEKTEKISSKLSLDFLHVPIDRIYEITRSIADKLAAILSKSIFTLTLNLKSLKSLIKPRVKSRKKYDLDKSVDLKELERLKGDIYKKRNKVESKLERMFRRRK